MTQDILNERVLIVEPSSSGHHFYYVKLLAERALSNSSTCEVFLLTTEKSMQSSEFGIHLAEINNLQITCLSLEEFSLHRLSRHPSLKGATQITIPDSDRLLGQVALGKWRVSVPTTFLVMRPDGERRKIKGLGTIIGITKKILIVMANLRANIQVFALKSPLSNRKLALPWISDPITLVNSEAKTKEFRTALDSKPPIYWVGVFGYITQRKNLDLVIDALFGDVNFGLFIAGSVDNEVWSKQEARLNRLDVEGRFVFYPGPLDDISLDSAIAAVDIVVAAHSNDGPSGIVAKAAALNRPLALAGARSLRLDSRNLGDRARWTQLNAAEIYKSFQILSVSESTDLESVHIHDDFVTKLLT